MLKKRKKVVVAMSGGVDSSVAAALLIKQGYDVIGLMGKFGNLDETGGRDNLCCTAESVVVARQVARKLKIPFYMVNLAKEFRASVINNFIAEYQAGRTPNPCVICNREIKFGLLLKKALALGAEFMATGHYARVIELLAAGSGHTLAPLDISSQGIPRSAYSLFRAFDKSKDQSYFLWALNQQQLSHSLFPIGNLTKTEVRKLAKKFKLPSYEREESQGICFIRTKLQDFLAKYVKGKPGKIIDTAGNVIGNHNGLQFYTIGQREGLGLGGPRKYYVVRLDSKKNILIVGPEKELYRRELIAEKPNWILPACNAMRSIAGRGKIPVGKIQATIRYGHPAIKSKIVKVKIQKKDCLRVRFSEPVRAITPGQSIVFYRGDEILGGAIIKS